MSGGMRQWGHGTPGRVITWPAPDTYVLVEGVLLRMLPDSPGLAPGAEVVVRHDAARHLLLARAATRTDEGGTDEGGTDEGGALRNE